MFSYFPVKIDKVDSVFLNQVVRLKFGSAVQCKKRLKINVS